LVYNKEDRLSLIEIPDVVEFASADVNEKHLHSHVIMKDIPAVPLLFSAESRAEGIPDWDGPDYQYSIFTTLFYADGSEFPYTYLDFPPGTHAWRRVECFCRARIPIRKLRVDWFFEHKMGAVAYRDFRIDEAAPKPEPDKRVVLLGDSNVITSYLAPKDCVHTLLAENLAKAYPRVKVAVENDGVGGEAIKGFLDSKRCERDLLTYKRIDVIFVRYGGNDRKRYDAATFAGCIRDVIRRLRADFPGIRIVLETGCYVDYPRHCDRDLNAEMKPNCDALRGLADAADGVLDLWQVTKEETERGNWDLRYRNNPVGKLIVDARFDAGHEDDPAWFSNVHQTPNCNRVVARAECEYIVENRLL
jgi:hypothetical protein